jgi:small subunit ribosomal protein S4
MARYIGPKAKISRKFKDPILGNAKVLRKKSYPPGQHGKAHKRKSEYALQLMEKQKAKYTYGLLERQFSNLFKKCARKKGVTGELLLQMLEMRIDNTIFRMGLAPSRRAARQLVSHNHILVNGNLVNIPSYQLKQNDIIAIKPNSKIIERIKELSSADSAPKFEWVEWDNATMSGKMLAIPLRKDIPEKINEQSIVELYSK